MREVPALLDAALAEVAGADLAGLEQVRLRYLGRKGELTQVLRGLAALPDSARRQAGAEANRARTELEAALAARQAELSTPEGTGDWVDLTFPGHPVERGRRHPVSRALAEIEQIFTRLGYDVFHGPEVEFDSYNFELLRIPAGHPARADHDSFYVGDGLLLRTHTSPGQIRYMLDHPPPLRVIVPGRCFRRDTADATHNPCFFQVEGLMVDEGIAVADLKGTLEYFCRSFFGEDRRVRLRPHHFPFTEPSFEVDVSCGVCSGAGCRSCGQSGWLEILGAGMVHPEVLRNGGIDADRFTGFAFGMGVERMTMLRFNLHDLRLFWENDLRFLEQF
ncbi:MAG: phenylalanine--tRNA ligase subunit alpha [Candidatus Dormibacteria bacterium]